MFDFKLTPREINKKFCWQACKQISIRNKTTDGTEDELGKGLQLKSQDELIGKDGTFRFRRIHKTKPNNGMSDKFKDEQIHDTRNSLRNQKELGNDKIATFNNLNEVFSGRIDRINEINDNHRVSTGKVSK
ncbi:uncharacterized protein OCT59_012713 [Rhizophagus irregularis]|uniref:Uncharacterized protein n=2 Tax=Rhizophagus irregularis TaxID=588596 RepID=U9UMS8_RHIID|nr:hypothetical protein OCT59_012713 [Rhizophagus irregularis]GBC32224.1 hypothetical protein GLOIN_2v1784569 [Rhizophagus irregularis DAOM 181602=DAOM 197198]